MPLTVLCNVYTHLMYRYKCCENVYMHGYDLCEREREAAMNSN